MLKGGLDEYKDANDNILTDNIECIGFIFILLSIIVFSARRSDKQKDDFSFSGIKIGSDMTACMKQPGRTVSFPATTNTEFSQETRLLDRGST